MTFRDGLLRARGHIVFLFALGVAFATVYALEKWETVPSIATQWHPDPNLTVPQPDRRQLSTDERTAAEVAWTYFAQNLRSETGLVDSVAGFPASTLWDTGSFLSAAIAAERLGIIPRSEFDGIMEKALSSLASLPLYAGTLPNKSFDTRSLAMTDYTNAPTETGIGWSALDLGRILIPLHVLALDYPSHASGVARVLDRWNIAAAVRDGVIMGAMPTASGYDAVQEGRVGYEQYSARGFAIMGYDVEEAMRVERFAQIIEVDGISIPVDGRDPEIFGGHSYTLSEPYVLSGLEFGTSLRMQEMAWRVYQAQENRFQQTGQLTAVTEDHLDQAPYFVYSSVFANGLPWNVVTDTGEDARNFRTLSTKAAFGWNALFRTAYTQSLIDAVKPLQSDGGWQAGIYELTSLPNTVLSANTNAGVLLAMHFIEFGPLLHPEVSP
ncbi:MAG: DUF3131 domain-containing protein [Pseudomonadota bacterium]